MSSKDFVKLQSNLLDKNEYSHVLNSEQTDFERESEPHESDFTRDKNSIKGKNNPSEAGHEKKN